MKYSFYSSFHLNFPSIRTYFHSACFSIFEVRQRPARQHAKHTARYLLRGCWCLDSRVLKIAFTTEFPRYPQTSIFVITPAYHRPNLHLSTIFSPFLHFYVDFPALYSNHPFAPMYPPLTHSGYIYDITPKRVGWHNS